MRVVIVGGHGQIARHVLPLLLARGDTVVPLVRRQEHADELALAGATPAMLDLEAADVDGYAAAFAGADAVLFAAGAGPDGDVARKRTVDLEGSTKSVDGARRAGVQRFVQVSAIGVDQPVGPDAGEVWAAYVTAKRDADRYLRASGLDWTIVRPGRLTDDPGTARVALAETVEPGDVPRADVALVLAAVLAEPSTAGRQLELVSGHLRVDEAIAAL